MNVFTFRLAFLLSYLHCKLCISRAFGRPLVVLCCENCGQQCGYITAMFGRRVLPVFALCTHPQAIFHSWFHSVQRVKIMQTNTTNIMYVNT